MLELPDDRNFVERLGGHRISPPFFEIILEIVAELESEPDTASINTRSGRILTVPPKHDHTSYTLLGAIPLLLHSLNVASRIIDQTPPKERGGSCFSILVLCAVAHDAGKLLKHRTPNYGSASHPRIGARLVDSLIGDRLNAELKLTIREIIELHHYPRYHFVKIKNNMAWTVAEADRWVREQEYWQGHRMYFTP